MSTDPQDEAPADDLTDSELDEVSGGDERHHEIGARQPFFDGYAGNGGVGGNAG
ncbi:MAG: hypothetical protein ACKOFP_11930 [Actinomycetota bacterium]